MQLIWVDNATNETGYHVYRRLFGSTDWGSPIKTLGPGSQGTVDTAASANTKYHYKVEAYRTQNGSTVASPAAFLTVQTPGV